MIFKNRFYALSYVMLLAASLVLAGCPFNPQGAEPPPPDAPPEVDVKPDDMATVTYQYRKPIDIDPRAAGLMAGLTEIPIAIILDNDAELKTNARSGGTDIVFTSDDGTTLLAHEIEDFDETTGDLVAWVELPSLPHGSMTTIYMYYGISESDEPPSQNPADTWSNGFAGVWHLVEYDIGNDASEFRDSTANLNHGTASGDNIPSEVDTGIVGPALDFDGASRGNDDRVRIPDPPNGSLDFGMRSFSWSLWVEVDDAKGDNDTPWFKGSRDGEMIAPGYDFELGDGPWVARVSDQTREIECSFGELQHLGMDWRHLVAVVDRAQDSLLVYANGELQDVCPLGQLGSTDNLSEVRISGNSFIFKGLLDEIRVYSGAITPDRIALEYYNGTAPDHLLSVGEEEAGGYPL